MPQATIQLDLFSPPDHLAAPSSEAPRRGRSKARRAQSAEARCVPDASPSPALFQGEAVAPEQAIVEVGQPSLCENGGEAGSTVRTLADVLALYDDAVSVHPARIRMRSALRSVGRGLQARLEDLPADLGQLAPRLAKADPALAGISPRQWRDVRYISARALRDIGLQVVSLRDGTPLTPEWSLLAGRLQTRQLQIGLMKFMRFCSRHGVAPTTVSASTFEAFKEELATQTLHADPAGVHRQTARLWNRAISNVDGWPALTVAPAADARSYALPWGSFPASLRADVDAFLSSREQGDEFADDYVRPVRRETSKGRRQALRRIVSALVLGGTPIDGLLTLADLCRGDRPRLVLKFLRDRRDDRRLTAGDLNYVHLLKTIARHWVKDEAAARSIGELITKLGPDTGARRVGMTSKNRERLRQFDSVANHLTLVELPEKVLSRVRRSDAPSRHDCVQVMNALIVAMQQRVPIRSKNLAELELETNIKDFGRAKRRVVKIYLQGRQTKTGQEYEAPLPAHLFPLLDAWLRDYRPQVCSHPSRLLFPNSRGEARNRDGLATQVKAFIRRETGLTVNMHFFRHLATKVVTDSGPGGLESASQLLGHTSTRTTAKAYANLKAEPAFRSLDETLSKLRHGPRAAGRRRAA